MDEPKAPPAKPRVRDLPEEARPREKLLAHGPRALADAELLAILLRTGVRGCNVIELARRLSAALDAEGRLADLYRFEPEDFRAFVRQHEGLRGIGGDKIATILAAIELGARVFGPDKHALRAPILRAEQVAAIALAGAARTATERFWFLPLDHRRAMIGKGPIEVTAGVGAQTLIDPATLFRRAILLGAHSLYVIHNHPSGDVSPSSDDLAVTDTLIRAGRTLRIPLRDHVIVGRPDIHPQFYSIRNHGHCAF